MKKHVFMILAHKNVKLLKDLIHTLSLYNGDVIVHVDAKSLINIHQEFKDEIQEGIVYFIEKNIKVHWGGSSIVWATFLLIDAALQKFPGRDYYHLLSEHCYPVKSPSYFNQFFEQRKGFNFIEVFDLPAQKWKGNGGLDRVKYYYLNDYFNEKAENSKRSLLLLLSRFVGKLQKAVHFKRNYPATFPKLYGGSQWWSLTYDCLKFIHDYYKAHKAFRKRFLYTLIADELFVQTIFMASSFAAGYSMGNYSLRYIDFSRKHTKFVGVLDVEYYWEKIQNADYLFARKVNPANDAFIKKLKAEIIYAGGEKVNCNDIN